MAELTDFYTALGILESAVTAGLGRISEVAGKQAEGDLKYRIFNNGLDATGGKIGAYNPKYARQRAKKGRQTSYVDLQFTGELFQSIQLAMSGTSSVLAITNPQRRTVAGALEEKYGVPIFSLSSQKVDKATNAAQNELNKIVSEALRRI